MPLRMDRFTWAVLAFVTLLLVGAMATLSLTNRSADTTTIDYVDEDSPSAAVYNAYVAYLNNDAPKARQYYSTKVLEEADKDSSFENSFYYTGGQNQRMRVLSVEARGENDAVVSIAIDRYAGGGLFNSGSTWTERQSIPVVREEDGWKIDSLILFY